MKLLNLLTHLSLMDLPTLISKTSPFPILGALGGIFHLLPFNRTFCKQTVKIVIRHRIFWVCTVCPCPIKRPLGLYGLNKRLGISDACEAWRAFDRFFAASLINLMIQEHEW